MRSMLPKAVRDLTEELLRLPGIGPKTAQRLAIFLLRQPRLVVSQFADRLKNLHVNVRICQRCFNLAEAELCFICQDSTRDSTLLCVVEDPLDVEALERTDSYHGVYHVLGGTLSPLDGIGPEQITVSELVERVRREAVRELIVALDQTMEADATTRYITDALKDESVTLTRLARGLPTGGDIEFADAVTLTAAITGRKALAS